MMRGGRRSRALLGALGAALGSVIALGAFAAIAHAQPAQPQPAQPQPTQGQPASPYDNPSPAGQPASPYDNPGTTAPTRAPSNPSGPGGPNGLPAEPPNGPGLGPPRPAGRPPGMTPVNVNPIQLSPKEKAELPQHPAGDSDEIGDEDLDKTAGGEVFPVTSGGYICTLTTECGCPGGKS